MNQKYEFTFLLNDEEELKSIKSLIASLEGKIEKEEDWGKKTLSFSIKKNFTAHFYDWIIDMKKSNMKEFKKKLNFNEKIIRYLILSIDL